MRRVDAHHHLWDPARRAYPWMDERLAPFQRRFGPEDLDAATGPHGIGQTVVVQTVASVEETKEFLAVAGAGGRVAGVVGWVDLTVADVADAVAALRAAPGGEALVGIRHQVHDEPDPAWLLRGEVLPGWPRRRGRPAGPRAGAAGRPGGGRAASAARLRPRPPGQAADP